MINQYVNKYVEYKLRKRSAKRKASEGMTAAIILIAFIITAAGIAFVILTMGSEMQLELGAVGQEGKDSASSAMQVEGGIVTAYVVGTDVDAFAFNVKLVLGSGQVDLSASSISVWISIDHSEETELTYDAASTTLVAAAANGWAGNYNIDWVDGSSSVLDPNEMARFYIGVETTPAAEKEDVIIIVNSPVATLKIEKTMPVGLVAGSNFI